MSRTRWPQDASRRDAAAPAGPPPRIRISIVADAKLLQRVIGAAVPARDRSIAHVLQIVDAHPRRPEAARREIAEAVEERDAVRELRLRASTATRCRRAPRSARASAQLRNVLSKRFWHSTSSHASPPRIATCRAGWSIIMKSMNSGTPASVALPDRSSFGMMMSASTRTSLNSVAVKNFGTNGFAVAAARAACADAAACAASASVHAKRRRRRREQDLQQRRGVFICCPPSADRRCTRWCASPAPGWSTSRSCPGWSRTGRRR